MATPLKVKPTPPPTSPNSLASPTQLPFRPLRLYRSSMTSFSPCQHLILLSMHYNLVTVGSQHEHFHPCSCESHSPKKKRNLCPCDQQRSRSHKNLLLFPFCLSLSPPLTLVLFSLPDSHFRSKHGFHSRSLSSTFWSSK